VLQNNARRVCLYARSRANLPRTRERTTKTLIVSWPMKLFSYVAEHSSERVRMLVYSQRSFQILRYQIRASICDSKEQPRLLRRTHAT
jgi:hypothetical protein